MQKNLILKTFLILFKWRTISFQLRGPTNGTCVNERLIISGQNVNDIVPIICGYNTGQHSK